MTDSLLVFICICSFIIRNLLTAGKCLESVRRASYLERLDRTKRKLARRMCSVFRGFRKISISNYKLRYVRLFPWKDSAGTEWIFMKLDFFSIFSKKKTIEKIQVLLKLGTSHGDHSTFLIISRPVLVIMKNLSNKSHFLF